MSVTLAFFRQVIHTQLQIDYHKMKNLCTFTTMLLNYLFTCSGQVFLEQNYQMANSTILQLKIGFSQLNSNARFCTDFCLLFIFTQESISFQLKYCHNLVTIWISFQVIFIRSINFLFKIIIT